MDRKQNRNFNKESSDAEIVKEITPSALKNMLSEAKDFQLIDVREPFEHEEVNIGGELIPFGKLMSNADKIVIDKPVIIYCKVGMRSHIAIQRLQDKHDYKNLYNLKGGITAYLLEK